MRVPYYDPADNELNEACEWIQDYFYSLLDDLGIQTIEEEGITIEDNLWNFVRQSDDETVTSLLTAAKDFYFKR